MSCVQHSLEGYFVPWGSRNARWCRRSVSRRAPGTPSRVFERSVFFPRGCARVSSPPPSRAATRNTSEARCAFRSREGTRANVPKRTPARPCRVPTTPKLFSPPEANPDIDLPPFPLSAGARAVADGHARSHVLRARGPHARTRRPRARCYPPVPRPRRRQVLRAPPRPSRDVPGAPNQTLRRARVGLARLRRLLRVRLVRRLSRVSKTHPRLPHRLLREKPRRTRRVGRRAGARTRTVDAGRSETRSRGCLLTSRPARYEYERSRRLEFPEPRVRASPPPRPRHTSTFSGEPMSTSKRSAPFASLESSPAAHVA